MLNIINHQGIEKLNLREGEGTYFFLKEHHEIHWLNICKIPSLDTVKSPEVCVAECTGYTI